MLKRPITYTNFDDEEVTEIFYFHIAEHEMVELEAKYEDGLSSFLQAIIKAKNKEELINIFRKIVLMAYGERSEDGKRFVKTEELTTNFSYTAAYGSLFMELATDDKAAVEFLKGIFPKKMSQAFDEAIEEAAKQQAKESAQPKPPVS